MIAGALAEGVSSEGVNVKVHNLSNTQNSDVIADILEAKAVLVGSPTLNNGLFPSVASFLAYMKGLKPKNKVGAVFGSYGWGGGAKRVVDAEMRAAGIELMEGDLDFKFRPTREELDKARNFGKEIARMIKSS